MQIHAAASWRIPAISLFILALSMTAAAANIVYPGYPLATDPFFVADSLFPNITRTGNTVTVNGGDIGGDIDGGVTGGADDVTNNLVTVNYVNNVGGTIYGGRTRSGNAVDNKVVINNARYVDGDVIGGYAQGGFGALGTATGNAVEIAGGYVNGIVLGGLVFGTGEAVGNRVTVSGGSMEDVWGGNSTFGNSRDNRVVIAGGTVRFNAYGGGAISGLSFGEATGNTITVTGGTVGDSAYGGYTTGTNANGNTTNVSGGSIGGSIYGGYANNGDASGNGVYFSGGAVGGDIVGGYAAGADDATNNYVELSRNAIFSGGIFGGRSIGGGQATAGNTLYLNGFGGTVQTVQNFAHYKFFLPNTLGNNQTLVTIAGAPVDMNGRTVELTAVEGGGAPLRAGDTLNLFSNADGTPATSEQLRVPKGIALLYDFDIAVAGGALRATVRNAQINPDVNVLPGGRGAGLAVITHYAELIDGLAAARLLQPAERRREPNVYAVATGGTMRYGSNSDLRANGGHLLAGIDWTWKGATVGAFLEVGHGSYDTRHSFDDLSIVRGGGDVNYIGGGMLAFVPLPGSFYGEGSLRSGWLKSDFDTSPVHFRNLGVNYDLSHPYFGLHAGFGHFSRPTEKSLLDIYAKYLMTRQSGDSVTVLGDNIDFGNASSHRLRAGARFSRAVGSGFAPFVGAAYEYEFDGKVTSTVQTPYSAFTLTVPSIKGGNGIGEIGCAYNSDRGLTVELGVKGYVGVREGVLGRLLVGHAF